MGPNEVLSKGGEQFPLNFLAMFLLIQPKLLHAYK